MDLDLDLDLHLDLDLDLDSKICSLLSFKGLVDRSSFLSRLGEYQLPGKPLEALRQNAG